MSERLTQEEILKGGRVIPVALKDGKKGNLLIREVPYLDFQEYAKAVQSQDLAAELAFYAEDTDTLQNLAASEIKRIRTIGREVNTDFFEMILEDLNPIMMTQMKTIRENQETIKKELATSLPALLKPDTDSKSSENLESAG